MASRVVFAFTIGKVEEKGWDYKIVPADTERYTAVLVDARWVKDHAPQPGGTLTRYDTGDMSYTPPRTTEAPPAPEGEPVLAGTTVDGSTELFVPAGETPPGEEDTRDLEP